MTETQAEFITAYIECALWSESIGGEIGRLYGMPEDTSLESAGFTIDDLTTEARGSIEADCLAFMKANALDLAHYDAKRSPADAGHDFWLTRNGHGAGFWDRGLGELGDRLSAMARPYGESNLYVGDDEQVHVA